MMKLLTIFSVSVLAMVLDGSAAFVPHPSASNFLATRTTTTAVPAFFGGGGKGGGGKSAGAGSPNSKEAVEIYTTKFAESKNREMDPKELSLTFKELASVYGDDVALEFVRDIPNVLGVDRTFFAPSFASFSEKFGDEPARAMVQRNTGLLFVRPTGDGGADKVEESAMVFSYIVAVTKPLGSFGYIGIFVLLLEPFFEAATGIPIKQTILNTVGF
mmetsp:Transcript_4772/g.10067  ORF Transcript_4772/g.10067 Transcript_4772/m.10067 type:complete len:216 (+) Transcript_4772:107-754(+)